MAGLIVALIAAGTLAFGAVYPWAFMPLFGAAALIGAIGLLRRSPTPRVRRVGWALLAVCVAIALQLAPAPRDLLAALSPRAPGLLGAFSLTFAGDAAAWVPLTLNPASTRIALLAAGALALFLIGISGHLTGHRLRNVPRALAIFAVPLALFGILSREYLVNSNLIYGFWRPQQGGGDMFGPFVNRNHFAGWMLMATCLLVGALFGQIERTLRSHAHKSGRQRRFDWLSSAEANGIVLMTASVFVMVISLFWTLSRSAITGFAVASVAFAWLAFRREKLGAPRRAAGLAAIAAVALTDVAWRGPARLLQNFQDDRNLLSRFDAWRDGWQVVVNFPLTGTGLNTYSDAMLFFQTRNREFHLAQAHNDYLQLLAEGGLLVAVPAVVALGLFARAVQRNLRLARDEARGYWIRVGATVGLLAVGVQEVFEFSLQMPANALLFCTLAAVALSPAHAEPARYGRTSRDTIEFSETEPSGPLS